MIRVLDDPAALAGGGTPAPTYRMLARRYAHELPWERVHLFWGDERMVPPDHPESNQRMVRRELIDVVDIPEENVHPVPTDLGSPEQAAEHYHHELRLFFALRNRQRPRFDLVLLGLGEDAHTASLFPGCAAVDEQTLSAREDWIDQAWSIVDPVVGHWESDPAAGPPNYDAGSWGPEEATRLIERDGRSWRNE